MKFDDIEFEMRDGDCSPGLLLKKDGLVIPGLQLPAGLGLGLESLLKIYYNNYTLITILHAAPFVVCFSNQ